MPLPKIFLFVSFSILEENKFVRVHSIIAVIAQEGKCEPSAQELQLLLLWLALAPPHS